MIFLPIVGRELRVASRRGVTYHTRFWTVFAAILICGWKLMSFAQGAVPPSQSGQNLFNTLSVLAFVYCLFCGAQVTADCLSEEKREGTLGLLFLTDLKGYDVILGKLAASSINSIYGVVSILPLLALPLLLGGVTANSFWRMALVLINTMFLSLAVGMIVSTLSRHERKAMMATCLVMFTLIISPYVILFMMAMADWNFKSPESVLPFIVLSPVYGFVSAMELTKSVFIPPGIFTDEGFWMSLLIVHLFAWLFLLGASLILPRAWKERQRNPTLVRWRNRIQQWAYGDPAERKAFRTRLLETNPFLWLAGRDRMKPQYAWGFLAAMIVVWLWGYFRHGNIMLDIRLLGVTLFLWHTVFKIWIISEASSRLVEEQQIGALESILSTPLDVPQILRGQLLALKRQFARPVIALLFLDLGLLWLQSRELTDDSHYTRHDLVVVFLSGMVMLVADLCTLSWVAMWQALCHKNTNRAILTTAIQVLGLPWLEWMVFLALFPIMAGAFRPIMEMSFSTQILGWLIIGLLTDLFCWRSARRHLLADFRRMATFQFQPRRSVFAAIASRLNKHPPSSLVAPSPESAASQ
ncbi:MAG: ABC transporter permease subunit [Verrucomicrobiota bacterium]